MDATRSAKGRPKSDIFVTDLNGPPQQVTQTGSDRSPSWSPDGRRLVFSREVPAPEGEWQRAELWTTNADGTDQRRLTQGGWDALPAWSPDGARIAFTKFTFDHKTSTFHQALYVMPAGGGEARRISETSGAPAWSPDGARLAVLDERDHNGDECYDECTINSEVYVINADGSNPVRLTQTKSGEASPSWSPDGTRILFSSDLNYPEVGAGHEIYSVAATGGCPIRLTNDSSGLGMPQWRPGSGTGPAVHAGPCRGGYRSTGRKATFHTDLRPARRFHRFPLYYLGRTYRGLLLSDVSTASGNGTADFHYGDCAKNPGRCGREVSLQLNTVCATFVDSTGSGPYFVDHARVVRGALLIYKTPVRGNRQPTEDAVLYTGGVGIKFYDGGATHPVPIARALRRFGRTRAASRLPKPRLPSKLIAAVSSDQRVYRETGSLRAAARRLHVSTDTVRFRLKIGAAMRHLGSVESVHCPARRPPSLSFPKG